MITKTFWLSVLCCCWLYGQGSDAVVTSSGLTGNLQWDLLQNGTVWHPDSLPPLDVEIKHKSPLLAAGMSAVIPGAGEFYAEHYWQSASFLGTEVILWIVYAVNTSRGDRETDQFQQYADTHWSVVRYGQWIEANAAILNPDAPPCTGIVISNDPNLPPWERVDWNRLNQCEEYVGGRPSTGFSHRLPHRPEQQYYELIGKYLQYNAGWDDWGSGPTTSQYLQYPSPRFASYRDMRGRANDFYNIATTASFVLVANHVLSALDAAWSASRYNREFKVRAHLEPVRRTSGLVEFVPTATVTFAF